MVLLPYRKVHIVLLLLLAGLPARGQDNPTFPIRGYQIEGNSLLPKALVSVTVMPFTGAKSTFDTIQLALEALEKAYLQAGYGSVKIELPEQDLAEGVVRLLVVEAKLDRITVEGQKFHSEANILRSLPALRSGAVVNVNELQRNLDLANDSFAKNTAVTFRQSEASAQTDALVRVIDDDPTRFLLTLDNTGNKTTGRYRLGLSFLHANLFDRDHSLSAQLLTSPTRFDKVAILGLGYHIPLYELGNSLDFTVGYSNVDSGRTDLFSISGSGLVLGARFNLHLQPSGEWQHKLSFGLDQRSYGSSVLPTAGGPSLVPDLQVRPVSLTYSGNSRNAQRDLAASATLTRNLAGGPNGDTAAFNQPGARAGADASFTTLKLTGNITERLSPDWSLRAALSAQFSGDLLISAEQFGVGGADSVRGLAEREVAADRGVRGSFEVSGPDLGVRTGIAGLRLQPIAFLDAGWVKFNVAPGGIVSQSVSSIGLGARGAIGRSASFKLDYAVVLNGPQTSAGGTASSGRGARRLHGSAVWGF